MDLPHRSTVLWIPNRSKVLLSCGPSCSGDGTRPGVVDGAVRGSPLQATRGEASGEVCPKFKKTTILPKLESLSGRCSFCIAHLCSLSLHPQAHSLHPQAHHQAPPRLQHSKTDMMSSMMCLLRMSWNVVAYIRG